MAIVLASRRNDGRDSLAIYTNPAFFADRWIDQMLNMGDGNSVSADGVLKKVSFLSLLYDASSLYTSFGLIEFFTAQRCPTIN